MALLGLSASAPEYSNLRIFNVRPGWVDGPVVYKTQAKAPPLKSVAEAVIGPIFRGLTPNLVSPTPTLARVLVGLAVGNGEPVEAENKDVENDGRTLTNVAVRRLGEIAKDGGKCHTSS